MKKIHWFIILLAVLILLCLLIWFLNTDKKNVISVNCQTDSLVEKISDDAKAGDTVVITGDCHEIDSVVINKDITLDGNNNTIFGAPENDVIVVDNATVTIKNITVTKGKHGIVSKNSIVFADNLITTENSGAGIIVVGKKMNEKEYNHILDSMSRINADPVELDNDNQIFLQSSVSRSTAITKNNAVCFLSNEQIQAAGLPVFKMTCGESHNNQSVGVFIADETKGCFGFGSTSCDIEVANNPWGIYARNANMAVGNATLNIHHNTMYGVGLALKDSVLTGNGTGTAFARMDNHAYNFSRQCGDTTVIHADTITLSPYSVGQCLNLP